MSTYVIGDIHGEYWQLLNLLDRIGPSGSDTIYTIGDIIDRGERPVECLQALMEMPNVIPLLGNHELMALDCLKIISREEAARRHSRLTAEEVIKFAQWERNGCETTFEGFRSLDPGEQQKVLRYMEGFLLYDTALAGGRKYLLVHGGLGGFYPGKKMEEYTAEELVWERPDYDRRYLEDTFIVCGHTPTQTIRSNPLPGFIYRSCGNIVIDCGACFRGGRLAALCLDTDEEFYSTK